MVARGMGGVALLSVAPSPAPDCREMAVALRDFADIVILQRAGTLNGPPPESVSPYSETSRHPRA